MNAENLADCIGLTLLGTGVHAAGIRALSGLGEITLRDSLVAAVAAEGARRKTPWIFTREEKPSHWQDEAVDLVITRKVNNTVAWIAAVELKWWRHADSQNSFNRRKALVRDFLRCASLSHQPGTQEDSLVVLVSTSSSWKKTTSTDAGDRPVVDVLKADDTMSWRISQSMYKCPAVRDALSSMIKKASGKPDVMRMPIPTTIHSKLLGIYESDTGGQQNLQVRIWRVRKPQKSTIIPLEELKVKCQRS